MSKTIVAEEAEFTQEQWLTYLSLILCCELQLNYNDDIAGTRFFKHRVRQLSKQLEQELCKVVREEVAKLWGVSDESFLAIMKAKKQVVQLIAEKVIPDNLPLVAAVLDKIATNPDEVIQKLLSNDTGS